MKRPLIIQIYRARDGWRWRMRRSGRIVAESGEAYRRPGSLRHSLRGLITAIGLGQVRWDG